MKKLPIDYLGALGSTVGDVYFPQTKLLLPFDGTNGATTTSDLSNRNATVTFNGNASVSTAQSKFGGSSLYLAANGDSVSISDTYWNTAINSGDFTIEFWVRFTGNGNSLPLYNGTWSGATNGWFVQRYGTASLSGQIIFFFRDSGGWQYINYSQGTRTTVSEDTWYHVAVTRNSNTWKLFLNGTAEDTMTNSNSIVTGTLGKLMIDYDASYTLTGYLDDIRITPGIARYTSNFTPPSTAHLTSAGDVNKQILINSTADGVAIGTGGINQARIAKAWVNFNGSGTVAIRDSYNVSSITDNATGRWRVNFSTNLANADFSVSPALGTVTGSNLATSALIHCGNDTEYAPSTSGFTLSAVYPSVSWQDAKYLSAQVFGN